jgi:chemotaxis regulatin CheY-phosphate phosphatase CheZ
MPRVTIGPDGNYELEPPVISSRHIIDRVNPLARLVDDATSEPELEAIIAHTGDVITKARNKLNSIQQLDNRLFWKTVPDSAE